MRTDVKLGFVIGGILLAVMIVYAVVVGRGGQTAPTQTAGVTAPTEVPIDATSHNGASTDTHATGSESHASTEGAAVPPATAIPDEPLATSTPAPLQTVTPTAPVEPVAQTEPTPAPAAKWNWDRLLHEGASAPAMMASDTGSRSSEPTLTDSAAPRTMTDATPVSYTSPSSSGMGMSSATEASRLTSPSTQPAGASRTHVVKAGETLSSISFASYGTVKHFSLIAKANPTINPDKLKPGMVLTIPAMSAQEATSKAPVPLADSTPVDASKQYKVQPGDTLHKIAMKLYGKTNLWEKIYDANKVAIGSDPAKLKAGMVLTLPEAPAKEKAVH